MPFTNLCLPVTEVNDKIIIITQYRREFVYIIYMKNIKRVFKPCFLTNFLDQFIIKNHITFE